MANKEHLKILRSGVDNWNAWRTEHPGIRPDFKAANLQEAKLQGAKLQEAILQGADLQGADLWNTNLQHADLRGAKLQRAVLWDANLQEANLQGTNLQGADLQGADLQRANLQGANLQGADLQRADLREANLQEAGLQEAILQEADLQGANLQNAKLQEADLQRADLQGANLQDAILWGADLQEAKLQEAILADTLLDSMQQLNGLAKPLSPEQLLGCIFLQNEEDIPIPDDAPRLKVRFSRKSWRPIDMALALLSLELASNRIQALCTPGQSEETLREAMRQPCYPARRNQGILVAEVGSGSFDVVLAFSSSAMAALSILYAFLHVRKTAWEGEKAKQEALKAKRENKKAKLEEKRSPDKPQPKETSSTVARISAYPVEYTEDLPSLEKLWKAAKPPIHTLSRLNGHSPETNWQFFHQGLSQPLGFVYKQYRDGFAVEVTTMYFDPEDHLAPQDCPNERSNPKEKPDQPPADPDEQE